MVRVDIACAQIAARPGNIRMRRRRGEVSTS